MNINTKSLLEIRRDGNLTREQFWVKLRQRLLNIEDLSSYIANFPLSLILKDGKLIVDYNFLDQESIQLILDPKDVRTSPFDLINYGTYEKFEAYLLHTLSKKITSFVDVGANVGFYTISVAKINQKCTIYSFEPNLNVFSRLKENISINHLGAKINLFNTGLGVRENFNEEFFVPKFTGTGGGSLKNLHPEEGEPEKISIQLTTLDSTLKSKQIDLIKIDVEGNEFDVIAGAMKTILKSKPIIFIELLRKWMKAFNHNPQEILEILGQVGYACFGIRASSLTAVSEIDEATLENNFIFCHKNDLETILFLESFIDEE